jgi:CubicO group peptidase (beta-lactamase class C family)
MRYFQAARPLHSIVVTCAVFAACSSPIIPGASAHAAPVTDTPGSASPQRAGRARLNTAALAQLQKRAAETDSDAVVIFHDGKLVAEWYFARPRSQIEAMSVTKSIASLAIGKLIDSRKLRSLDQPISELFPEWRQGRKQTITIRHLLDHTSGLQDQRSTVEIYPSYDYVKLALAAELSEDPGTAFRYNNKAVNLLAAIVKAVSGKPLDQYMRDEIFSPMGITDIDWHADDAGTPQVMAGLQIRALDLARLGQLMLDGGMWRGKRILSQAWIDESTRPSQPYEPCHGLLWWLQCEFRKLVADDDVIARWRKGGAGEDFIAKLLPIKDRVFTANQDYIDAIERAVGLAAWEANTVNRGLPPGKHLPAPITGFRAAGYLGQYLVVIPAARLVAVRQRRSPTEPSKHEDRALGFREFPDMVRALVH